MYDQTCKYNKEYKKYPNVKLTSKGQKGLGKMLESAWLNRLEFGIY